MNIENLNKAFVAIVEKKAGLADINKASASYDAEFETVTNMEHKFIEEYGAFIEEALFNVHDEYCSDNKIMFPLAYMANKYLKSGERFEVEKSEGVEVDADDIPGVKARLVLVPGPTRLVLQSENDEFNEVVWMAKAS